MFSEVRIMRSRFPLSFVALLLLCSASVGDDLGQRRLYDSLTFYAQTSNSSGAETNAASPPAYRVYEVESGAPILTGLMTALDPTNTVGFYSETIELSPTSGFERGKQYAIRFRATVSSVNMADFHTFTLHPNEILVQHDGNNATSGATLESRIEAASAGTLVVVGPGVFDIGTAQIVIPSDVSLRGAGIGATQVSKSNNGICVVPGDRSVIEHLTIDASASGQGFGSDGTQQFDDAVLRFAQVKGHLDAIYVSGTGASTLTMEGVWIESDVDGMIVADAGHKVSMRDVFIKAAHENAQGISVSSVAEIRGTSINIDITFAQTPAGVSVNDAALVELFDSSIWVDPATTYPTSINVNSSLSRVRLVNCEFDRALMRGYTQQIRDVFSPLRPTLLSAALIASLTSQTVFTLTVGPPDNDSLNGALIIITDSSNSTRKAVAVVADYDGSTRQVTLSTDPGIFTIAVGDQVDVVVTPP
jgi:hypothetical protein